MNHEELARRAVACKHWRWMVGMRTLAGDRVVYDGAHIDTIETYYYSEQTYGAEFADLPDDALPDLTDPATLGCVLALVREAWGQPRASAGWFPHVENLIWYVADLPCGVAATRAATEAAALIAALEAAP